MAKVEKLAGGGAAASEAIHTVLGAKASICRRAKLQQTKMHMSSSCYIYNPTGCNRLLKLTKDVRQSSDG